MRIALLETFFTGSHKQWAESLKTNSQHKIDLFTLKGKNWKWRMYGGAIPLAQQFVQSKENYDLILCTDMMDLSLFLSLSRSKSKRIKSAIYFHENQLTYPWSSRDKEKKLNRDRHYAFINYTSALVADKVYFNSHYHMESFLGALDDFLRDLPSPRGLDNLVSIRNKAEVLYIALDLKSLKPERQNAATERTRILWNHRWEEDKNPTEFLEFLRQLNANKFPFELVLLGERALEKDRVLAQIEKEFAHCIVHNAYAKSKAEYVNLLSQSTVLPVTSNQDFFGISIVEAIACGVLPYLPDRLSYKELVPKSLHSELIYRNLNELTEKFSLRIDKQNFQNKLIDHIDQFDWSNLGPKYDQSFLKIVR